MLERRFHVPADGVARVPCRVCYQAVDLHPDYLVETDGQWVMTCPQCRGSFPVRIDDSMVALLERQRMTESA
jgi:hypothetical protein